MDERTDLMISVGHPAAAIARCIAAQYHLLHVDGSFSPRITLLIRDAAGLNINCCKISQWFETIRGSTDHEHQAAVSHEKIESRSI